MTVFRKKTNSAFLRSHLLPRVSQLGVGLHEALPVHVGMLAVLICASLRHALTGAGRSCVSRLSHVWTALWGSGRPLLLPLTTFLSL